MTLPDGILAYYLLKCANLTDEQQNICKATCDKLTYDEMRKKIERVTSNNTLSKPKTETLFYEQYPSTDDYYANEEYYEEYPYETEYDTPQAPHEESQNTTDQEDVAYYAHVPRGSSRPPYRHPHARSNTPRVNISDEYGNPTKCSYCQSIFHYREECPDYQKKTQSNNSVRGRFPRGASRGRFQRGGQYRGFNPRPQNNRI